MLQVGSQGRREDRGKHAAARADSDSISGIGADVGSASSGRTPAEEDRAIVLVTVNKEYLEMFKNWLHFAKPFLRGRTVYVVAEDSDCVKPLKALSEQLGNEVDIKLHRTGFDDGDNPDTYGTKDYGQLVGRRGQHILDLMEQKGAPILYVDVDTVWLKDPFQDIHEAGRADLYLTVDHPGGARPYCTCFIYARPTEASRLVLKTWSEKVVGESSNQGVFNDWLKKLQETAPIKVSELARVSYPHGNQEDSSVYSDATVLHANYMKGLEAKRVFLGRFGKWDPRAIELDFQGEGKAEQPAPHAAEERQPPM